MRFIGNKEAINQDIALFLQKKGLFNKQLVFFDAFCGTGAVSDLLKSQYRLVVNDMIKWSTVYTRGRLNAMSCQFDKLGFDPFKYFSDSDEIIEGFFFHNYSPGGSERQYFSAINAARIDFFRMKIEEWWKSKLINEDEYCHLLASLIESISYISNTAGVYGAFLKHWDSRAMKPIIFQKVNFVPQQARQTTFFNSRVEDIIQDVSCDILYLDPPYTQNQYGTQYHLLQTLVLNDEPSISKITGSRPTGPIRSDWSKEYRVHILFEKLIATTQAKHIILSYSSDGIMSKSYIDGVLNRHSQKGSYECHKIDYKRYKNFKSKKNGKHQEYLFYIEKKSPIRVYHTSPLNYIGSKASMVDVIRDKAPRNIDVLYDLFGGAFNVGINIKANRYVYNDINHYVSGILRSISEEDIYKYILFVKRVIKNYNLTRGSSIEYINLRSTYNSLPESKRDPKLLFSLVMYGFNQQLRFNSNHEFNNPVGARWFNDKVLEKLVSFSRILKENDVIFTSVNYEDFIDEIGQGDFVYLDPPYRLTTGSYNDGKRGFNGWSQCQETRLMWFIDNLNERNIKFMLSYILKHKGQVNDNVAAWVKRKGYNLNQYQEGTRYKRIESLITNY